MDLRTDIEIGDPLPELLIEEREAINELKAQTPSRDTLDDPVVVTSGGATAEFFEVGPFVVAHFVWTETLGETFPINVPDEVLPRFAIPGSFSNSDSEIKYYTVGVDGLVSAPVTFNFGPPAEFSTMWLAAANV